MPIVSTTLCYPSPAAPTQGIFVQRRLQAINELMPVRVVAPVLWFPFAFHVGHPPPATAGKLRASSGPTLRCAEGMFQFYVGHGGPTLRHDAPASPDAPPDFSERPPVVRPRMFYLPGIWKSLDARFYARAFEHGLTAATRDAAPDLVDAHFEWPDGVGAWLVARRRGLPFVCTLRGKLVSQIAHPAKRRRIREMLLGADALIAVSRSLADLANEVAGRDLGIRVIPNGVNSEMFRRFEAGDGRDDDAPESTGSAGASPSRIGPLATARARIGPLAAARARIGSAGASPSQDARAACGWTNDARYVVSVGHLQALKGWHRLIAVWPEVRRRAGDVRLVLVGGDAGDRAYARRIRTAVEAVNRQSPSPSVAPITLLGRVDPHRLATLLNAADLFALTSQSEGWCNAIAEALACGCPVVATDVGGNRELVNADLLGRLVPLDDREALVDAICKALSQSWDRRRISDLGGRRNWQQVALECADVFKDVLNRRAARPCSKTATSSAWPATGPTTPPASTT